VLPLLLVVIVLVPSLIAISLVNCVSPSAVAEPRTREVGLNVANPDISSPGLGGLGVALMGIET